MDIGKFESGVDRKEEELEIVMDAADAASVTDMRIIVVERRNVSTVFVYQIMMMIWLLFRFVISEMAQMQLYQWR